MKPSIDELVAAFVNTLIENFGVGYEITSREIRQMMQAKQHTELLR